LDQISDPYPIYARLRQRTPLPISTGGDGRAYLLTRHADVRAALHDSRLSSDLRQGAPLKPETIQRMTALGVEPIEGARTMLSTDPPDHGRLRGLVSAAFTPTRVNALAGRIQELTEELLDEIGERTEVELMSALAEPLPALVIAELLGIPAEDRREFKAWTRAIVPLLDVPSEAQLVAGAAAQRALREYFARVIAARRREPGEDLVSALVAARDGQDALSEAELGATCNLLLNAGHETTTNLIGNGVVALLNDAGQLEALRANPSMDRTALEELLRYDAAVQGVRRMAVEPVQIGGAEISKGSLVLVLMGSANRDPEVFKDPDRLDLTRDPNPHLSFGHGIHTCLGASLARLEGRIALRALLDRFPSIELARAPVRSGTFMIRGYREVMLRVARR
jgi:cytochrome P450